MVIDNRETRQKIETGLGTIGRIKIMAELAKKPNGSFTKYALLKGTGLKRSDLKENLRQLITIDWIKEYKSIYPAYQINLVNPTVQLLSDFFKKSGYV